MKICSYRVENDRREKERERKRRRKYELQREIRVANYAEYRVKRGSGARLFKSNRCLSRIRGIKTMSSGEFASRSLCFELEANDVSDLIRASRNCDACEGIIFLEMLHHASRIRSIFTREPTLEFISHDPVWIEIYRGVETFWRRLISLSLHPSPL